MINKLIVKIENAFLFTSVTSIFIMMIFVSVDALGRYLFHAPLEFQFELTTYYLMVISVVMALAWGAREGANIKITIVSSLLPEPIRRILVVINNLIIAFVFIVITYSSGTVAFDAWYDGDVILGVIDWPVWLARIWVPIGCGMMTVRFVFDAYRFAVLKAPIIEETDYEHLD